GTALDDVAWISASRTRKPGSISAEKHDRTGLIEERIRRSGTTRASLTAENDCGRYEWGRAIPVLYWIWFKPGASHGVEQDSGRGLENRHARAARASAGAVSVRRHRARAIPLCLRAESRKFASGYAGRGLRGRTRRVGARSGERTARHGRRATAAHRPGERDRRVGLPGLSGHHPSGRGDECESRRDRIVANPRAQTARERGLESRIELPGTVAPREGQRDREVSARRRRRRSVPRSRQARLPGRSHRGPRPGIRRRLLGPF